MNQPGFERDVLAAPARLAALLDAYTEGGSLAEVPLRRSVVFLGMGSSRFAGLPAAARLRAGGLDAVADFASGGTYAAPRPDLLAVGISASGTSPETVEALARHRGIGATVAVTNDPESPLAEIADVVLPLHAGAEEGEVSCLTFQNTQVVLQFLTEHLLGHAPDAAVLAPAVEAAEALRANRDAWLPSLASLVDEAQFVSLAAPAERLSTALQGALMLREGPRVHAAAAEAGDWLHVDVYLAKRPGYALLLSTGTPADAAARDWCLKRDARLVALGPALAGGDLHVPLPEDPLTRLLVEPGVADLVACEVWRRRLERGDPVLV